MDGNGAIGVSNRGDRDRTVGPYGIAHQNASGKALLDLMRSLGVASATSFFDAGAPHTRTQGVAHTSTWFHDKTTMHRAVHRAMHRAMH